MVLEADEVAAAGVTAEAIGLYDAASRHGTLYATQQSRAHWAEAKRVD